MNKDCYARCTTDMEVTRLISVTLDHNHEKPDADQMQPTQQRKKHKKDAKNVVWTSPMINRQKFSSRKSTVNRALYS